MAFALMAVTQQKRIQMLKVLRRAQQNEIETNAQYINLVDNMPILYMKEQVIWDKEGNIIDSIYQDVNRYFERCFLKIRYNREKGLRNLSRIFTGIHPFHEYHLERKEIDHIPILF